MPKLPKGMFKRTGRDAYYTRNRTGGRDRWISLGADYADACKKLRQLREGLDEPVKQSALSVRAVAKQWLATRIANGRNKKGQQIAAARVRDYLNPFMGHMIVSKITPNKLRVYRLWLERRCATPTTVAHILGDCRGMLYWCEECGLIDKAPIPRRWLPRLPEREPDRLTDDEVDILLSIPGVHGWVIELGLGTGMRWGELCRVQASDLQNGVLVVGKTKSGRVRRIPVAPGLQQKIRRRVGRLVPFSERSPGSFAKLVRNRTGVERFHVHQLRHTFACRWLEDGGSLAALQELLGHASVATTQKYAKLNDDLVRREAQRVWLEK